MDGSAVRLRRLPLGLAVILLGVVVLVRADVVRRLEANAAALSVGAVTGGSTEILAAPGSFAFGIGTPAAMGLRITSACSVAYLLGPFLIGFGLLSLVSRLVPHRLVAACLAGSAVLIAVNMLRITLIGWATYRFGLDTGYWWSHVVVGSVLAVSGFTGAVAVALLLAFRGRTSRRVARPAPRPSLA